MATTIRNPIEWGYDQIRHAAVAVEVTGRAVRGHPDAVATAPAVRRIDIADLKDALAKGLNDFGEARSDVIFLCLLYPVAGLVIAKIVFGSGMFALLFPLVSGFALLGPFVAVGLYEMSRQREEGHALSWATETCGVPRLDDPGSPELAEPGVTQSSVPNPSTSISWFHASAGAIE